MTWARAEFLLLIPILAFLIGVGEGIGTRRRARVLLALGRPDPPPRSLWSVGSLTVAASLLSVALAGPGWGRPATPELDDIDVVLALDVSRSMTVTDVSPRRAELARLAALRLAAVLSGRVALVAFAAEAHLLLPPSHDREVLALYLETLDPDVVSGQGSDLALPIHTALDALEAHRAAMRPGAVVLITDGEGFQEDGELDDALRRARRAAVPVHTLLVGTPEGSSVPGVVGARSEADPETLQRVARVSGGRWADVRDRDGVEDVSRALRVSGTQEARGAGEGADLLALLALTLLVLEAWLGRRRPSGAA